MYEVYKIVVYPEQIEPFNLQSSDTNPPPNQINQSDSKAMPPKMGAHRISFFFLFTILLAVLPLFVMASPHPVPKGGGGGRGGRGSGRGSSGSGSSGSGSSGVGVLLPEDVQGSGKSGSGKSGSSRSDPGGIDPSGIAPGGSGSNGNGNSGERSKTKYSTSSDASIGSSKTVGGVKNDSSGAKGASIDGRVVYGLAIGVAGVSALYI